MCIKGKTLTVDNTVCGTGVEEVDEVVVLEVVGVLCLRTSFPDWARKIVVR